MSITIETPASDREISALVEFYDEVYAYRPARWPAMSAFQILVLTGQSPFNRDRELRPFVALHEGRIVARVVAVVDERYRRTWNERIGHLIMFEALAGTREATRQLMDTACEWLTEKGAITARTGMGMLDFAYAIEDHDTLPPCYLRQNPAYYQSLLKDAGFESEKGLVDYRIRVTPALVERWESALESVRRAGFDLVPLADVPEDTRIRDFMVAYNEPFLRHWGYTPFSDDEIAMTFQAFEPFGILEHSLIAYREGEPMGAVWVQGDASPLAQLAPGRALRAEEKVNFLGIAMRPPARGRGVNLAMAAHAYLDFARRGYEYLSYTLVLDDNWPSRRTAEKLGASVCNNYLVYRRNLAGAVR
jgi:GNAT superfamily N-acetyltransferase